MNRKSLTGNPIIGGPNEPKVRARRAAVTRRHGMPGLTSWTYPRAEGRKSLGATTPSSSGCCGHDVGHHGA